ncbi:putative integrase [Orientia chuto str. Dubai]|uniref:Putative integrase n=1 Tax=Orientia chuto str. Dubai TaxID=1359168 RepID=A0A0F3MN35_9RICK|nr:hypothetical protein [Candidatus Orientia mediorientalis]KJV56019.1 putative integrase [Orientia chuto str. Dubai]
MYSSKSGHLEQPEKTWRKVCARRHRHRKFKNTQPRRTFASCMADAGAGQYIIGIVLIIMTQNQQVFMLELV